MSMKTLIVHDGAGDFPLVERTLKHQNIMASCCQVTNMSELSDALRTDDWDVVLYDLEMPELDRVDGFDAVRRHLPDTPIVLLSGAIGEESAVDLLKLGFWDLVRKDRLERLPSVIERCIEEAGRRRAKREAEAALRSSEEHYRSLFETMFNGLLYGKVLYENSIAVDLIILNANAMFET